jgi:protocatechuate 3,4-dioxygenase alpha subunit
VQPTPSQTVGPFFGFALPYEGGAELAPDGIEIHGTVTDGDGQPVPDALIEIWQADADGRYRPDFGFGRCPTGVDGRYRFVTIKPGPLQGQAPHIAVSVLARGLLQRLVTRIYFPDEPEANAVDPVLQSVEDPQARAALVATEDDDGLHFDIHLQGDRETAFFAV